MDNIILKKIILKNISELIINISYNFNIDKKEIIDRIFIDYNIILNNDNINCIDIYNNVGMDELSLSNSKTSNNRLDNMFSLSR